MSNATDLRDDSEDETENESETESEADFLQFDPRGGKDEMNLAGNPFALVRYGTNPDAVIEYEWTRRLPDGKSVVASWRVAGDAQLGLPGPSEECLYLVLLDLTREAGWQQTVHFSRYDVLQRLGWPDAVRHYRALADGFTRLTGVGITAKNAFWSAESKSPLPQVGFSLIDNYQIANEPRGRKKADSHLPLSFFKWNDVLFQSFQAGNVRDIAIEFALSLRNPTARRLFRYLDMHRYGGKSGPRKTYRVGLDKLRDHLGLVGLEYASKIKERLGPAHAELLARGFLSDVTIVPMRSRQGEMVVYTFANVAALESISSESTPLDESVRIVQHARSVPAFVPTPLAVAVEIELAEAERRDAACDVVFAALPAEEKAQIENAALNNLAPFLRTHPNTPGARMAKARDVRNRVFSDYRTLVVAHIESSLQGLAETLAEPSGERINHD